MAGPPGAGKGAPGLRDALALGALLAALWLTVRPYYGIVHDARLYTAQALHRLGTAGLEGDLFFKYGSQDSFSAFSLLFAPAVAHWGPGTANLVFAMAGQAFWLAALGALALSLFGRGWLWLASMGAAIAMTRFYGWGVMSYGEPFVTPRLFAEAMTLLALAATLRGRKVMGVALVCAAALLHPLMALPGLLVILALCLPVNRWTVLGAAAALCTAAALALAGVEPFGRALQVYDDAWLAIVKDRTPHAFVADWSLRGLLLNGIPLLVLSLTSVSGPPLYRRLARVVVLVAGGFVFVSWLGGDILWNVLVLNLQLWRALWIFAVLGNLLAVQAVLRLPQDRRARAYLVLALAVNLVESWIGYLPVFSACLGMVALVALAFEALTVRRLGLGPRLALDLAAALLLVGLVLWLWVSRQGWLEEGETLLLGLRLVLAMGALGLLLGWERARAKRPVLAALAPLVLLAGALGIADQRSDWAKYVENGAAPDPALSALVGDRATYWEQGAELLWFKLKRPSFYSCLQGAGIMFYRSTALEYARRREIVSQLNTDDFDPYGDRLCRPDAEPEAREAPTAERLAAVCRALHELDLIVLRRPVDGVAGTPWRAPAPMPVETGGRRRQVPDDDPYRFHFYSCGELRQLPAD
ncbi:MAG: hypothetical protein ACP5DX_15160 [Paracoccaceae bacterium]